MRKALMGLILAATAATPIAAEAQNWRGHDGNHGDSPRTANENGRGSGGGRAARAEHQQAQQQEQQQPAQQPQPAPQVAQRQRGGDGNGGNRNNWRGDSNNNGGNRGGNRGGNQTSIYPQAWQGNPNDPRLRHYQELERQNQQRYSRDGNRGDDGRNWRNDRRGDHRRADWNRGWRGDRRYDWSGWRNGNRRIFHLSPYYSPYRNYGYSRFSIGFFLEPLFFDQRYWIDDPWQYRLPPAAYGTQWVRYYNDVLLVDIYTGEVLDTIYDFFW